MDKQTDVNPTLKKGKGRGFKAGKGMGQGRGRAEGKERGYVVIELLIENLHGQTNRCQPNIEEGGQGRGFIAGKGIKQGRGRAWGGALRLGRAWGRVKAGAMG